MPAATVIAGIGLAISAGSTALSISAQNKQQKAQKKAAAYQKQIDNLQAARQRVQAIRQARLAAGSISQAAENQGASTSSAALGALGSIESQLNSNLSFLDSANRLSDQAGVQLGKAAKYGQRANTISQVGAVASKMFMSAGSMFGPDASGGVDAGMAQKSSYDNSSLFSSTNNGVTVYE